MPRLQLFFFLQLIAALNLLTLPGYSVTRPSAPAAALLLAQANQARQNKGLTSLSSNALLAEAALYHALQMAEHDDISHGFNDEPDLSARGAQAGVHFSLITENVAEAQSVDIVHDLWMNSPDHRANLLDPEVDAVGIAVVEHRGATFAVEDFAATVEPLSLDQQEEAVLKDLSGTGLANLNSRETARAAARTTCSLPTGYAGAEQPWYVMRYTAAHLNVLPAQLRSRITSGRYRRVAVGACQTAQQNHFTSYSVAVLLYP